MQLIENAQTDRDKAIIGSHTECGLRLSELVSITPEKFNWESQTITILGKDRKEAYAPFSALTEKYLRSWLSTYKTDTDSMCNIWGLNQWGTASMLRKLEAVTGIRFNPHTFNRTLECLLRKAGVDIMTIKDLGRWESLEMVQRYTRSIRFQDIMRFYRAPLP